MLRRDIPPSRQKAIKRVMMRRRIASTGPSPDVVEAVYERAQHSCEICTCAVGPRRGDDHHIHHRRPRALGGTKREDTNLPSNLMLLCPSCHADVESNRGEAQAVGWLLRQNDDPAAVAVLVQRDRWVYLTVDATYSDDPPDEVA
jgi:5-methylcytosine-specific restriction endonuclease McrA